MERFGTMVSWFNMPSKNMLKQMEMQSLSEQPDIINIQIPGIIIALDILKWAINLQMPFIS